MGGGEMYSERNQGREKVWMEAMMCERNAERKNGIRITTDFLYIQLIFRSFSTPFLYPISPPFLFHLKYLSSFSYYISPPIYIGLTSFCTPSLTI